MEADHRVDFDRTIERRTLTRRISASDLMDDWALVAIVGGPAVLLCGGIVSFILQGIVDWRLWMLSTIALVCLAGCVVSVAAVLLSRRFWVIRVTADRSSSLIEHCQRVGTELGWTTVFCNSTCIIFESKPPRWLPRRVATVIVHGDEVWFNSRCKTSFQGRTPFSFGRDEGDFHAFLEGFGAHAFVRGPEDP